MNSDQIVAKRYAKALFEITRQNGTAAAVEEQLKALVTAIRGNADLNKFLQHPNIEPTAKHEAIKQAFKGELNESLENLLGILLQRGREQSIEPLYEAFVKISNEELGQADAVVTSPSPLAERDAEAIAKFFGEKTGKTIRVERHIDPSLLGGVQVRIGDRLYDGSLKSKLASLQKTLLNSQA